MRRGASEQIADAGSPTPFCEADLGMLSKRPVPEEVPTGCSRGRRSDGKAEAWS